MNRRAVLPAARQRADAGACSSAAPPRANEFRAIRCRIALVAVLLVCGLATVPLRAESANSLFKHGEAAEAKEDYDDAFDFYQKAVAKAPNDLTYKTALYRIRVTASAVHMTKGRKLVEAGDEQGALAEFLHAAEIDPGNESAQQEIAKVRKRQGELPPQGEAGIPMDSAQQQELNSIGGPVVLKPLSNEPLTLHYSCLLYTSPSPRDTR